MKEKKFPVVELFGPTIQGEGTWVGKRCSFVRFAGCDFSCVWCDSKHSWDPKHPQYGFEKLTAREIIQQLCELDPKVNLVIITGGNPLLHDLTEFVSAETWFGERMKYGIFAPPVFSIETQGTMYKDWIGECGMLTISPKLSNAGIGSISTTEQMQDLLNKTPLYVKTCIKPVVFNEDDVREAWAKFGDMRLVNDFVFQVGTLPTDDEMALITRWREIVKIVLAEPDMIRARVLPQSHVLLWGHKLGV